MSVFEKLKPRNHGIVGESLLNTASGLYGTMIGILVESMINGSGTTGPILETPVQLIGTGAGMTLCAFRSQIYEALEKLGRAKNAPAIISTPISINISPRTNLWNQLALGQISREEFDKKMQLIANT